MDILIKLYQQPTFPSALPYAVSSALGVSEKRRRRSVIYHATRARARARGTPTSTHPPAGINSARARVHHNGIAYKAYRGVRAYNESLECIHSRHNCLPVTSTLRAGTCLGALSNPRRAANGPPSPNQHTRARATRYP